MDRFSWIFLDLFNLRLLYISVCCSKISLFAYLIHFSHSLFISRFEVSILGSSNPSWSWIREWTLLPKSVGFHYSSAPSSLDQLLSMPCRWFLCHRFRGKRIWKWNNQSINSIWQVTRLLIFITQFSFLYMAYLIYVFVHIVCMIHELMNMDYNTTKM